VGTEVVTAGELAPEDEIEVNLGFGKTFRTVDTVVRGRGVVTVTLFASDRPGPRFVMNVESEVVRMLRPPRSSWWSLPHARI
jgi:hypothetical protein